jgi:hypothetical protein
MQFTTSMMALVGSAALASAASVTFKTLDDLTRTVYFTPSAGHPAMEPVTVSSAEDTVVTFPDVYVGNYHAVVEGQANVDGMLGEVNFGGWNGMTYFDVSAIVNPGDKNNVKKMWPKGSQEPVSGCDVFPCNNAYYLPDDVQTKVTHEVDLITTLGGSA